MSKSDSGNDSTAGSDATEPGVYRVRHDSAERAEFSGTVIEAISAVADVDPTETVVPLSDRIDPDALDALFTGDEGEVEVSFRIWELDVRVRSDGWVRVVDESIADESVADAEAA